jgi:lactocepin
VLIVGGELAVPKSVESQLKGVPCQRLAGANAVDTMQAIVRADGVFTPSSVDTVVVAGRRDFKAALAGTGLAGLYGAPLLITEPAALSGATRGELQRLKPSTVLVCGDTGVVSAAAFNAIKAAVPGASVTRVSGATPSGTAVAIHNKGKSAKTKWGKTAIVATQAAFKDALSVAPYAYAKHAPIFFTESGKIGDGKGLSAATLSAIKKGGFTRVLIVGGELAVPWSVDQELSKAGISTDRLAGQNAIETSYYIGNFALNEGMTNKHMAIVTTQDFADALSGAALAGAQNSILVLVNQKGGFDAFKKLYMWGIAHGHILGGPLAISEASEKYIRTYSPNSSMGW